MFVALAAALYFNTGYKGGSQDKISDNDPSAIEIPPEATVLEKLKNEKNTTAKWESGSIQLPASLEDRNTLLFDFNSGNGDLKISSIYDFNIEGNYLYVFYFAHPNDYIYNDFLYLDTYALFDEKPKRVARRLLDAPATTPYDLIFTAVKNNSAVIVFSDLEKEVLGELNKRRYKLAVIDLGSNRQTILPINLYSEKTKTDNISTLVAGISGDKLYIWSIIYVYESSRSSEVISTFNFSAGVAKHIANIELDRKNYETFLDVAVRDDVIYVLNNDEDINVYSNAGEMEFSFHLDDAQEIEVEGNKLFIKTNEDIHIYDLTEKSRPTFINYLNLGLFGLYKSDLYYIRQDANISLRDPYLYLTTSDEETIYLFNISNTFRIDLVGIFRGWGSKIGVTASGKLYAGTSAEINEVRNSFTVFADRPLLGGIDQIAVSGNYSYGFDNSGGLNPANCSTLYVTDIRNINNPKPVTSISPFWSCEITMLSGTDYFMTYGTAGVRDGIDIYDISDPAHPSHKAYIKFETNTMLDIEDVTAFNDLVYVLVRKEINAPVLFLYIYDISSGQSRKILDGGRVTIGSANDIEDLLALDGSRLLILAKTTFDETSFIQELDVSNPASPKPTKRYAIKGHKFAVLGDNIFLADAKESGGFDLRSAKISELYKNIYLDKYSVYNTEEPTYLAFRVNVYMIGSSYLVVNTGSRLHIFDVSKPDELKSIGSQRVINCYDVNYVPPNKLFCKSGAFYALYFLPYQTGTALAESLNINKDGKEIESATLSAIDFIPDKTSLTYYLSNNGGLTWEKARNREKHEFSSHGNDLRFKIELFSSDYHLTPEIFDIDLEF